ncbi:hypothetical protein [Epilithonimonas zeae]|uniref:hypothetical protein n=1 Tax=Epilithonimonas zeae TaxID=1416779 RepID=UPI00200EAC07|nr:hypothetical protein [Epilithonimonas zeae]UQB68298.1 hypothetical protein KI430_14925 [Epilithonimonas zeae]
MKNLILFSFSLFLFIIALAIVSHPGDSSKLLFFVLLTNLICGLSISFMVFALSKTNSKRAFVESLKYSFGISSLIMILGYLTFCLEPIIF